MNRHLVIRDTEAAVLLRRNPDRIEIALPDKPNSFAGIAHILALTANHREALDAALAVLQRDGKLPTPGERTVIVPDAPKTEVA